MKISDVNLENIHTMANMLDGVGPWEFDLSRWVAQTPQPAKTKFFGLIETTPACGFAGCAMGWAAHNGTFPGLSLVDNASLVISYDTGDNYVYGFHAAERLFGINDRLACYFFHAHSYMSMNKYQQWLVVLSTAPPIAPYEVAARLRKFASKIEAIRSRVKRTDISDLKKFTEVKLPITA